MMGLFNSNSLFSSCPVKFTFAVALLRLFNARKLDLILESCEAFSVLFVTCHFLAIQGGPSQK